MWSGVESMQKVWRCACRGVRTVSNEVQILRTNESFHVSHVAIFPYKLQYSVLKTQF